MTMLRNRHIDLHRSAARRQVVALHEAEEPMDRRAGLRPDEVAEQQEVFAAVHALASPFRETVVAVDVIGLSYKEAAYALGRPGRHDHVAARARPPARRARARARGRRARLR